MPARRRPQPDAVVSPLESYFREIDRTPLLKADEERALARRTRDGDPAARDHLVRANLRLVVSIARGYAGRGLPFADLVAEGNLGLLRAAEMFDPDMNTRFSTYASFWIKQSLKRAIINTAKTVRLPAYVAELLSKWRRAGAQLKEELGRPPTDEEVARQLNLPRKKRAIIQKALLLHDTGPQGAAGEDCPSADATLPDTRCQAPDAALADSEELGRVLRLVGEMDERSARVLRLRFGLDGQDPRTLQEVGEHLGLTRERVRQIEREALAELAERMQELT